MKKWLCAIVLGSSLMLSAGAKLPTPVYYAAGGVAAGLAAHMVLQIGSYAVFQINGCRFIDAENDLTWSQMFYDGWRYTTGEIRFEDGRSFCSGKPRTR